MSTDSNALNSFLSGAVADLGAAMSGVLVGIGDELGFYRELAQGPLTPHELATRTHTSERCVREWLANQAAGGLVCFEPAFGRYHLNEAQAACLSGPGSPFDLAGTYRVIEDFYRVRKRVVETFRTGERLDLSEHQPSFFDGVERFYGAIYRNHLLTSWLPALEGVVEKLSVHAAVADLGCGQGGAIVQLAQSFPASEFIGVDNQPLALEMARRRAREANAGNVRFVLADAAAFREGPMDLILLLNSLHSMVDPAAVLRHAYHQLRDDGHVLIVAPRAGDRVEDNLTPVGRMYYAASVMASVPTTISAEGAKLGSQAGEKRLQELITEEGGFTRFRHVGETPLSLVMEARR